jgi:hypothetical protein
VGFKKSFNAASAILRLLDLAFLVDHMFADNGVVLFDFHFLRVQPFIFVCGVKMTGSGR